MTSSCVKRGSVNQTETKNKTDEYYLVQIFDTEESVIKRVRRTACVNK